MACLASVLCAQGQPRSTYYRMLNPPHATLAGASGSGPAEGGALGSANLFPVVGGRGWLVDMGKGSLSILVPNASVPGEMPIPVVFRFNASRAWPIVNSNVYVTLGNQGLARIAEASQGALSPQLAPVSGRYIGAPVNYSRPIFGSIDFGFITAGGKQSIPGTDTEDHPSHPDYFNAPRYFVLEDGSFFADADFSTMSGTGRVPTSGVRGR